MDTIYINSHQFITQAEGQVLPTLNILDVLALRFLFASLLKSSNSA